MTFVFSHRSLLRALASLGAAVLFSSASVAQETTIIARTGDPAPDGNGTFASFINDVVEPDDATAFGPTLNDLGQAAFAGYLINTQGGPDDNSGLFVTGPAGIAQIVREGQSAPDGDGFFNRIPNISEPAVNNAGAVTFSKFITDAQSGAFFESGVFHFEEGTLRQVLRQGDPSPDGDSAMDAVFTPSMNEQGQLAFTAEFEDQFNPLGVRGVLRADLAAQDVTVLARDSDPAPNGVGSFDLISGGDMNENGQVVFSTSMHSTIVNDFGLYRVEPDGAVTPIVRYGDPSPDSNETFTALNSSSDEPINNAGQVAVAALMSDSGGQDPPSSAGIFLYDEGALLPIARTGQSGPGQSIFIGFGVPGTLTVAPALNDAGQVAFFGYILDGGFQLRGIFRADGTPAGMTRIVDNSQPAPDGNGYIHLGSSPAGFDSNDVPKMNNAGQVAFFTNLRESAGGVEENEAIFFYDDALGLLQVARKGDDMLGSTITELRFTDRGSLAHNNIRSGLNNRGQVAYAFELADGTGGVALWSPPGFAPLGDLNCDGSINAADIDPFVLALTDPAGYAATYPGCDTLAADMNGDGGVNAADIDPFVQLVAGG